MAARVVLVLALLSGAALGAKQRGTGAGAELDRTWHWIGPL